MKQKVLFSLSLCSVLVLAGCVSEQSYVGSDKPVSERTFDNIEAARTRISLGLNYLRRGDTSQAKYNLERAKSFAPNAAEVYSALAYYYQNVGEAKQAEEYFKQAISKDSNYADAYNNYGAFLCQLKRYDEAEQLLLKAISRPGYIRVAESYENLSLCQLQQNSFTKAKSYLDNSIGHNSTRISSLTMAAALDYAMGDTRQAKAQLDRIQRLGRVSARTVLLSYLIAEKSGDRETMRSAEQLLLTLYTETPETRLLLQGKLQESEFEQLRERYKDSLMANIVVAGDDAKTVAQPAQPRPNPKLKIVKRKNADEAINSGAEKIPATEKAESTLSNSANAIVSSLDNVQNSIVKPAEAAVALPVETVLTVETNQVAATVTESVQPASVEPAQQDSVQVATETESVSEVASATDVTAQQKTGNSAQGIAQLPSEAEINAFVASNGSQNIAGEISVTQQEIVAQSDDVSTNDTSEAVAEVVEELQPTDVTESVPTVDELAKVDVNVDGDDVVAAEITQTETTEVESAEPEQVTATDSTPFHIVQASESLYSISVKHNIRLQRLMQWNQLAPDSVIKTGQKIWLGPVTETELTAPAMVEREQTVATEPYHTVVTGETMFGISYKYNVRLSSFMQWNNLTESSKLQVGQKVLVVDPDSVAQ